ncbi:hypothetical protein [Aliarcobacter butzleri]|uniref:hypothetical protein n=1 Tax=Aliarcobacter butzleri TaxID=28197 RepID=UPI00263D43BF|nr:hypothetical protein [Aliarcobacter butzleri]MDN5060722.1 hypothetical protein [Aliarcobacter butzleri]
MTQERFQELLKSDEFKSFKKRVDDGKYDFIDWFNLENEIEKIADSENKSYEYYKIYEYFLENRFAQIKKYVVKPTDLNVVFEEILNELIYNLDTFIKVSDFYNANYQIQSTIKNQVTKTINYLLDYNVIEKAKKGDGVEYKTNSDFWHKQVNNYIINDTDILQELTPIIASYIKNGNIKTYNIQKLFYKFSKIIEYAIIPAIEHNPLLDTEFNIQIACENQDTIEVIHNDKKIEISPLRIVIKNDSKKYIQIKDGKKTDYIPINEIKIYEEPILNTNSKSSIKSTILSTPTTNLSINTDFETIQEQEELEVILECDNIVYEYFKIKQLKNMKVFDTEDKLKEFQINYEIKPKNNKFYIVANDRKPMIISTVLHTLKYVKVLTPNEINDDLISLFKDYASRIEFKICNDETPPPNPSEPSSKKEDIKSNEPIKIDERFKEVNERFKDVNKDPL